MRMKIVFVFLALATLQLTLSEKASAQTSAACWGYFIWYFPDQLPFAAQCGPGQGNFSMICFGPNGKCPPPSWCPDCGKYVDTAGAPINLTNGNTYIKERDLHIPGLGGGLSLERTWNSIWPSTVSTFQVGMFGMNWRSTYEERLISSPPYVLYLRANGGYWYFGASLGSSTNYTLSSPANTIATLVNNTTTWTLTFQNGEQRIFDYASGSLVQIIDRNGNTTQLTYDGSHRLITVTDPASRTLSFSYSGSSTLVSGVSTSAGISLSYVYDTSSRLTQVTNPDSSTISFTYNSQSLITNVTDTHGVTLESHTYDTQGRGLTSSRSGGVDAVTITYP